MMNQEDEMNGNEMKYASLTAGLLARKGEAVPAAAAFTAEAIAQHIPARRLAQEAERVLLDRRPSADRVIEDTSIAWRENQHESRGAQVVTEHRDMIERAFDESVRQDEGMPSVATDQAPVEDAEDLFGQSVETKPAGTEVETSEMGPSDLVSSDMDLGRKRDLNLAPVGPVAEDLDASLASPVSEGAEHLEDGSALSDLNDSEENWFETIVSDAISEAEGQQAGVPGAKSEPATALDANASKGEDAEGSLVSSSFARGMADDRFPAEPQAPVSEEAPVPEVTSRAPTGGCSDKAARVREAIRSGQTNVAARSAMRLDPRRFIRLSLTAQKLQLSSQDVMLAALDSYMDSLDDEVFSDCACMKKGLI